MGARYARWTTVQDPRLAPGVGFQVEDGGDPPRDPVVDLQELLRHLPRVARREDGHAALFLDRSSISTTASEL